MAGVQLEQQGDATCAHGVHVEGRVQLSDVLAVQPDGRFTLLGRHADMVNLAGRRTSLAYLNEMLRGIDGVQDGAFFLPCDDALRQVGRLAAFVVAPDVPAPVLQAALRERIDPVFLPRPLVQVPALPRNATGKLLRATLEQLYRDWAAASVPREGGDAA